MDLCWDRVMFSIKFRVHLKFLFLTISFLLRLLVFYNGRNKTVKETERLADRVYAGTWRSSVERWV